MLQSSNCTQLCSLVAGTAQTATNVSLDILDFVALKTLYLQKKVEMVVVGPEDPFSSWW
jgi:phosphoribosylamine-glycine ligase